MPKRTHQVSYERGQELETTVRECGFYSEPERISPMKYRMQAEGWALITADSSQVRMWFYC